MTITVIEERLISLQRVSCLGAARLVPGIRVDLCFFPSSTEIWLVNPETPGRNGKKIRRYKSLECLPEPRARELYDVHDRKPVTLGEDFQGHGDQR